MFIRYFRKESSSEVILAFLDGVKRGDCLKINLISGLCNIFPSLCSNSGLAKGGGIDGIAASVVEFAGLSTPAV